MTNHRDRFTGRNVERDIRQDRSGGVIGEVHAVKHHRNRRCRQRACIRGIDDLALGIEQPEHPFDIGQRLTDLPVDHAKEIERHIQLDQEGIDQDQIPHRHRASDNALRGMPHHRHQTRHNNQLLPHVEHGQRHLAADRGIFPAAHRFIVAVELEGFVIEVLNCLVVDQAVDGTGIGRRVRLIHCATNMDAPVRYQHGKCHVTDNRGQRNPDKHLVIFITQHADDQRQFNDGRQYRIQRITDQIGNRPCATINVP